MIWVRSMTMNPDLMMANQAILIARDLTCLPALESTVSTMSGAKKGPQDVLGSRVNDEADFLPEYRSINAGVHGPV